MKKHMLKETNSMRRLMGLNLLKEESDVPTDVEIEAVGSEEEKEEVNEEEGIEDRGTSFRWDSASGVDHPDHGDPPSIRGRTGEGAHVQIATLIHRVACVQEQVEKCLLELFGVEVDHVPLVQVELLPHLDRSRQCGTNEIQRLGQQLVDPGTATLRLDRSTQLQHVLGQGPGACDREIDDVQ